MIKKLSFTLAIPLLAGMISSGCKKTTDGSPEVGRRGGERRLLGTYLSWYRRCLLKPKRSVKPCLARLVSKMGGARKGGRTVASLNRIIRRCLSALNPMDIKKEAISNIVRMWRGGRDYYIGIKQSKTGPAHFPPSTGLTPARRCCLHPDKRCPANPSLWRGNTTWRQLGFSIKGPHFYQYQFVSQGKGDQASFTARALGDLDCDGVYSTFERVGRITKSGYITAGSGLWKRNLLE